MSKTVAWVKASRFPSLTFIYPSLWLGQVLYFSIYQSFSVSAFIILMFYGVFIATTIVYANDYADFETDQLNDTFTPFTGGSRVLINNELTKKELATGAIIMAILNVLVGIYFYAVQNDATVLLFIVIGLVIFHAYSFKPVEMSYRGFGESLQMLGVGVILPLVGFTAQGGLLTDITWPIILIFLPSQLAMAVSTSLPDEPSDRKSRKMTTVVHLGNKLSKVLVIALYLVTFISLMIYLSQSIALVSGIIFGLIILGLILLLAYIYLKYQAKPGSQSLFTFVALSILLNTVHVVGAIVLIAWFT